MIDHANVMLTCTWLSKPITFVRGLIAEERRVTMSSNA